MKKVIVEKSGGIVNLRINRPEVMNACDGETYDAIVIHADPEDANNAQKSPDAIVRYTGMLRAQG